MWNNEFKLAILNKDTKQIDLLLTQMPQFETLEEMQEAFYLMNHARELLEGLKDETAKSMKKIKETIRYIESTSTEIPAKLDIMQ
jgi:hypothetical protein